LTAAASSTKAACAPLAGLLGGNPPLAGLLAPGCRRGNQEKREK
jgi:hypothetical protein